MKKYFVEMIILLIQLFLFYIFPFFAGPIDSMGTVIIILIATIILSTSIICISKNKIKYLYPFIISIVFIPSVFIHYNGSALIHTLWYFIDSFIGVLLGIILNRIYEKTK